LAPGPPAAVLGRSVFELVKVETFLRDHNLYILRARKPS